MIAACQWRFPSMQSFWEFRLACFLSVFLMAVSFTMGILHTSLRRECRQDGWLWEECKAPSKYPFRMKTVSLSFVICICIQEKLLFKVVCILYHNAKLHLQYISYTSQYTTIVQYWQKVKPEQHTTLQLSWNSITEITCSGCLTNPGKIIIDHHELPYGEKKSFYPVLKSQLCSYSNKHF